MNSHSAVNVFDTLRHASALLKAGRHAPARELLGAVLRGQPNLAEAHWLLAGSFFQTDDLVNAQRELQVCIRLQPRNPEPHVLAGRIFVASGQPEAAARAFRQALQIDGDHASAAAALARVLLMQGRAEEARAVIEPLIAKPVATSELRMLYGHALMVLGRPAEAEAAFRNLLEREPDNGEARCRLAAILADDNRSVEAETEVRTAIARAGVKSPDAAFVLARALMGQGRFEEAEAEFRQVVRARPDHVTAQSNLSELVWMRTGNVDEASAEIDAVLRAQPRFSALRIAKARLLLSARRSEDALAVVEAGLSLAAQDADLLNAAVTIALDFDGKRALEYAQRSVRLAPDDRVAQVGFGNASLAVGQARQALDIAERLHRLDPADGQALAMQADALRMLGDPRYRELLDYRHFVRAELLDVPAGWPDLDSYLTDLVRELERRHVLQAHPIGNSLRQGSQVELDPDRSPDAAIRAFPRAIDGPIRRYMRALGPGSDPMRRRNTGRYRISGMWSVRLRPHGFHVNHYHPRGWLSSACYLHLPAAIESRGGEGWLKFGEPAFPTTPALEAEYFLKPEPGLLALFPAYLWHGTVPFAGAPEENRLTIAFDVLPA